MEGLKAQTMSGMSDMVHQAAEAGAQVGRAALDAGIDAAGQAINEAMKSENVHEITSKSNALLTDLETYQKNVMASVEHSLHEIREVPQNMVKQVQIPSVQVKRKAQWMSFD